MIIVELLCFGLCRPCFGQDSLAAQPPRNVEARVRVIVELFSISVLLRMFWAGRFRNSPPGERGGSGPCDC